MKSWLYRTAVAVMLALWAMGLSACADTSVIGGCPVPSQYDVQKTVGPDLPATAHQKQFDEAATKERGDHKKDVGDYNGFLGYVKTNCK